MGEPPRQLCPDGALADEAAHCLAAHRGPPPVMKLIATQHASDGGDWITGAEEHPGRQGNPRHELRARPVTDFDGVPPLVVTREGPLAEGELERVPADGGCDSPSRWAPRRPLLHPEGLEAGGPDVSARVARRPQVPAGGEMHEPPTIHKRGSRLRHDVEAAAAPGCHDQ